MIKKVHSGEPLRIRATDWNTLADMANGRFSAPDGGIGKGYGNQYITVYNASTTDSFVAGDFCICTTYGKASSVSSGTYTEALDNQKVYILKVNSFRSLYSASSMNYKYFAMIGVVMNDIPALSSGTVCINGLVDTWCNGIYKPTGTYGMSSANQYNDTQYIDLGHNLVTGKTPFRILKYYKKSSQIEDYILGGWATILIDQFEYADFVHDSFHEFTPFMDVDDDGHPIIYVRGGNYDIKTFRNSLSGFAKVLDLTGTIQDTEIPQATPSDYPSGNRLGAYQCHSIGFYINENNTPYIDGMRQNDTTISDSSVYIKLAEVSKNGTYYITPTHEARKSKLTVYFANVY